MTDPNPGLASRVARRLFPPLFDRLDALRSHLTESDARVDRLAATCEQLQRQVERLEAFQQVSRDEARAEFTDLVSALPDVGKDVTPAIALRSRLDHALLHAEALNAETRELLGREIADLRGAARLTQALAERAARTPPAATGAGEPADPVEVATSATTMPGPVSADRFEHAAPGFDLLYRAFEDRHRGSPEAIAELQRDDYLEMLAGLPAPELPVVDLGCGRGELVEVLRTEGITALGVDSNLGQVVERLGEDVVDAGGAVEGGTRFVEGDLFDWLDARDDASCRAVVSMHVVEHLPLDLQVRLVFEARRVLVEGGVLVLETPNTLSLSTAATNFWVDPTHQRPVHPLFLEFLATEAGFPHVETKLLHPIAAHLPRSEGADELVDCLDSLLLGCGDLALVARR